MKKVFLILLLTSKIFAQETITAESIQKPEEVVLTEEQQSPQSETKQEAAPTVPVDEPVLESHSVNSATYDEMLPLIISQLKIPGGEELLWEMTSPDYDQIKNNDFEYVKVKPEKIKSFKEIISSSDKKDFALNVFIELGSYDFKKESYPIKALGHTVNAFMSYDVDLAKSGLIYTKVSKSKPMEDKGYMAIFEWRILKTDKFKDLKLKKAEAEKLSAELGPNRKVHCVLAVSVPAFNATKEKFLPHKRLKAESNVKNMTCYSDSARTKQIAELP